MLHQLKETQYPFFGCKGSGLLRVSWSPVKSIFWMLFCSGFLPDEIFSYLIPKPGSGQRPVAGLFSYTEIISSCLQPSLQLTKSLCLLGKSGFTVDFKDLPPLAQERASDWDRRSLMGHIYSLHSTQQYLSVFSSHKVGDCKEHKLFPVQWEYPPRACCLRCPWQQCWWYE